MHILEDMDVKKQFELMNSVSKEVNIFNIGDILNFCCGDKGFDFTKTIELSKTSNNDLYNSLIVIDKYINVDEYSSNTMSIKNATDTLFMYIKNVQFSSILNICLHMKFIYDIIIKYVNKYSILCKYDENVNLLCFRLVAVEYMLADKIETFMFSNTNLKSNFYKIHREYSIEIINLNDMMNSVVSKISFKFFILKYFSNHLNMIRDKF